MYTFAFKLVARDLIKRGTGGAIVNISTVLTQIASAGQIPYSEYSICGFALLNFERSTVHFV